MPFLLEVATRGVVPMKPCKVASQGKELTDCHLSIGATGERLDRDALRPVDENAP